ncbi:MAG: hypothetical protein WAW73_02720 [Rhodoferax sp.]
MRAVFGVFGLLIVLAIVAVLAKKQLGALNTPTPAGVTTLPAGATPQQQSQQIQKQIGQTVESTLQQARPMPDDK